MNAPLIFAAPGEVRVAAALVEAVASWDECVLLLGEAGMDAVLDRAAHDLSARRVRCVRVRAPASGGLALRGLMAQVVGRTDPNALTDQDLEAGFAVLTEPGDGHDRVALLVEGAHALLSPAARYIQLACRSSPHLRVVLAGRPGLEAVLVGDEFADLRRRFSRRLALPGPGADGPMPDARSGLFSAVPGPAPDAPRVPAVFTRVRDAAWTLTKLGLAASLVVWMVRLSSPQPPPAPRPASLADAADPSDPPAAAPPRAGSAAPLAVWTTRWEDVPASPGVALPDPGRPADPVVTDPIPAGRETPITAAPFAPPAAGFAAPPMRQPAMDRALPADAAPPASADVPVPDPAAADVAAPRHVEKEPTSPPVPAAVAVQETPPAGITPPAERDAVAAPAPVEPPREGLQPPVEQRAVGAGTNAPEAPARNAGSAVTRAPEPAPTPFAPEAPARDVGHATARVPEPLPTPSAPERAARDVGHAAARVPEPLPVPPAPEPAAAALPLPPIPPILPPPSPQPAPRPPIAAVPQPEASSAARRARTGTERATVAPVVGARSDERRCRDLVLKAQLGETLSDAEKQFLRGGCRVE